MGSASKAALRAAGANHARMVVVRAGKSFPEQETSDADADTIGQLVEARGKINDSHARLSMSFFSAKSVPKNFAHEQINTGELAGEQELEFLVTAVPYVFWYRMIAR